ncbi:MAG: zinc ribbon domain-containing protein, partial [Actinomycetota bacterium]|nr:zinc ribbon domain-containing protein [Actinomycetota bacterium]
VTGAAWSGTTVKRLLCSARIAGQREHHGQRTTAVWPPIITLSQSTRVRTVLNRSDRRLNATGNSRTYLLSGFVYCGDCGTQLTARPVYRKGHRYPRFHCSIDRGGCNRVGIASGPLDDLITEAVLLRLDGPELADAIARRSEAAHGSVELERAIAEDEAALEELTRDRYVERTLTPSMFAAARDPLEQRLAEARAALAAVTLTSTVELPRGGILRRQWPELDLEQRRAVLGQIVDRIIIAPTTRADNRFNPARVDVIWKV